MSRSLEMWTVYDHPTDYPDGYVVRLFLVDGAGPRPTTTAFRSDDLAKLRAEMVARGLTCLMRDPSDDPKIVETWL